MQQEARSQSFLSPGPLWYSWYLTWTKLKIQKTSPLMYVGHFQNYISGVLQKERKEAGEKPKFFKLGYSPLGYALGLSPGHRDQG